MDQALAACATAAAVFRESMTDEALAYLHSRGLTDATIQAWGLGWAPGGRAVVDAVGDLPACEAAGLVNKWGKDFFRERVMIPIHDAQGIVVGFAGRMLPEAEAAVKAENEAREARGEDTVYAPKYLNTAETLTFQKRGILFGMHKARKSAGARKALLLCEGQFDVIAAHQLGHDHAVATCGTALTEEHLDLVMKIIPGGDLIFVPDQDDAGRASVIKALPLAWAKGIPTRVHALAGKDIAALLQAGESLTLAPQSGGIWLVNTMCQLVPVADADRLVLADQVMAKLLQHPDRDWQEIHAAHLGEVLNLGAGRMTKRLREKRKGSESAPTARKFASGGDAEGESLDDTERDRGLHRHVVRRLEDFLRTEGITPDAVAGWMRSQDGTRIGVKSRDLVKRFLLKNVRFFESLSTDRVSWTLDAMVEDRRKIRRKEVLDPLTAPQAHELGMPELRRWVRAVTGKEDPVDVAVVAHFLWQVKRRVAGLEVDHDVMPILVGKQGDGKSKAVKRLVAGFQELVLAVNATTLTDDRCREALSDYIIGVWDELQGGNKADVQALKHIITADLVAYRELGGHTYNVLPKSITLIATSNDHVSDIIPDTGGARRYYELLSRSPRCDWDEINAIPYFILWQAVSHLDPAPILPVLDQVRARQVELVHKDPVVLWLQGEAFDQLELVESDRRIDTEHGPTFGSTVIPAYHPDHGEIIDHTYRRFARWCRLSGQPAIPPNKFGGRLKALGFERRRGGTIAGGSRPWRYHLPTEIPEDWACAERLAPRTPKTAADRAATEAAAAAAFNAVPPDMAEW